MINKKSMKSEKAASYALHERRVLSRLRHPFLISLYCSFQTHDNVHLSFSMNSSFILLPHFARAANFLSTSSTRAFSKKYPINPFFFFLERSSFLHSRSHSRRRKPALVRHHPPRHQAREHPSEQRRTHRSLRLRRLL